VRRWRWLLYKNARDEDDKEMGAKVAYSYMGESHEVSLDSTEGYDYGAFDMESSAGLYPGCFYVVGGVVWAMENTHA
jgi:hypothetical protein